MAKSGEFLFSGNTVFRIAEDGPARVYRITLNIYAGPADIQGNRPLSVPIRIATGTKNHIILPGTSLDYGIGRQKDLKIELADKTAGGTAKGTFDVVAVNHYSE